MILQIQVKNMLFRHFYKHYKNYKSLSSIRKQPLCICRGKAAYNIPPSYLRIAKSVRAMGYKVFIVIKNHFHNWEKYQSHS